MTSLLTEPVAATVLVLDRTDGATLTEIARATGKPLTTIQRAVDGLAAAGILVRDTARRRWRFAPTAPRRALRELAEWRLDASPTAGTDRSDQLGSAASGPTAPRTIHNEQIRAAWPTAIHRIVSQFQPERVILFGSQARGDAGPDSDVDFLVVFDDDANQRERRIGIRRVLGDMPFAKDVLVGSVADLQRSSAGTAVAAAIRDGIVVYER
ncbi:MAG: nucleotidyltransferase domain-containing protein [Candidatus Limnocylindrales bacterium]